MAGQTTSVAGVSPPVFERTTMMAADALPVTELLTHNDSLDDLPQATRDMEERPEGFPKGWIRYD